MDHSPYIALRVSDTGDRIFICYTSLPCCGCGSACVVPDTIARQVIDGEREVVCYQCNGGTEPWVYQPLRGIGC